MSLKHWKHPTMHWKNKSLHGGAALIVTLSLFAPNPGVAQTRVSLDDGRASVIFPLGTPQRAELSPSDIEYLRKLEAQGEAINHRADVYEARVPGEWFIASATDFAGTGTPPPPPPAGCVASPPAARSKLIREWSCRQLSGSGVPGMEVRYINPIGEAISIRSYYRDGRVYMLLHGRGIGARPATGREDPGGAFLASFQLANP